MKKALHVLWAVVLLLLAACHHEEAAPSGASTGAAQVTCYAGKDSIYDGATAAGQPPSHIDGGIELVDAKTGRRIQIYGGTCLVVYDN